MRHLWWRHKTFFNQHLYVFSNNFALCCTHQNRLNLNMCRSVKKVRILIKASSNQTTHKKHTGNLYILISEFNKNNYNNVMKYNKDGCILMTDCLHYSNETGLCLQILWHARGLLQQLEHDGIHRSKLLPLPGSDRLHVRLERSPATKESQFLITFADQRKSAVFSPEHH